MMHKHEAQSLLEKMEENFEEARIYLIGVLPKLYQQFQHLLAHSTDLQKDEATYLECAHYFIRTSTARSIYFGQFVNGHTDQLTREAFKPIRRTKKVKKLTPFEQLVEDLELEHVVPDTTITTETAF